MNIKKQATAILGLFCMLHTSLWAAESSDTLVIEGVDRVRIETRDTVQRIVISGSKDDPYLHYVQRISIPDTSAVRRKLASIKNFNRINLPSKTGKRQQTAMGFHLSAGLNTMVGTPADYSPRLWPSIETSIGVTLDWMPFGKRNAWTAGVGIGWHNYRFDNSKYWTKDAQNSLTLQPYDDAQQDTRTSLSVFSLQVPLLYTHHFDDRDGWALSLGAVFNVNTTAHATRQFTLDDEKHQVETHSIGHRPLTVDGIVMLRTPGLFSFYCKYSPTTFFKDNHGPKMHQLSFGIYL